MSFCFGEKQSEMIQDLLISNAYLNVVKDKLPLQENLTLN